MRGWLKKKGRTTSFWRDRYFVLHADRLDYYASPSDVAARHSVPLRGYAAVRVLPQTRFERDGVFELFLKNGESFYIQAGSNEDRDAWMKGIRRAVKVQRKSIRARASAARFLDDSNTHTQEQATLNKGNDLNMDPASAQRAKRFLGQTASMQRGTPKRHIDKLPPVSRTLQHFAIYEAKHMFYVIGWDDTEHTYRVMKLSRTSDTKISCDVDEATYTRVQIEILLDMVRGACEHNGGLKGPIEAVAILGTIQFIQGHYLVIATKTSPVGQIGGHWIHTIDEYDLAPLFSVEQLREDQTSLEANAVEGKYYSRFMTMDLTRNFYFSYTYDLTNTLQHNMRCPINANMAPNEMYVWNTHLLSMLTKREIAGGDVPVEEKESATHRATYQGWFVNLIHGYVEHSICSMMGRRVELLLLSRRSIHYAGTRYLKRGVNSEGYVANDVETEQIVFDRNSGSCIEGQFSSYTQMRGSIPIYWSQESNAIKAKPPIQIDKIDPFHQATRRHFQDVFARYGAPCLVLNLIRQEEDRPRESKIGPPFEDAVRYLNGELPKELHIDYKAWDFKKHSRLKTMSVVDELMVIAEWAVHRTGFFHSSPKPQAQSMLGPRTKGLRPERAAISEWLRDPLHMFIGYTQRGVCRSNCIDSLDRTNVAQFCISKCALGYMMYAMGLHAQPRLASDSYFAKLLLEMFERNGDALAMQYGGSQMHRQMRKDRQMTTIAPVLYRRKTSSRPKEFFVSLMRHYQNSFNDNDKQEAMNLFLGKFVPNSCYDVHGQPIQLWDVRSDYYMHNPLTNLAAFDADMYTNTDFGAWWSDPIRAFESTLYEDREQEVPMSLFDDHSFQSKYNSNLESLHQGHSQAKAFLHARESPAFSSHIAPLVVPVLFHENGDRYDDSIGTGSDVSADEYGLTWQSIQRKFNLRSEIAASPDLSSHERCESNVKEKNTDVVDIDMLLKRTSANPTKLHSLQTHATLVVPNLSNQDDVASLMESYANWSLDTSSLHDTAASSQWELEDREAEIRAMFDGTSFKLESTV